MNMAKFVAGTHTNTHTQTHTQTHTLSLSHTHTFCSKHTQTNTHTLSLYLSLTHTLSLIQADIQTCPTSPKSTSWQPKILKIQHTTKFTTHTDVRILTCPTSSLRSSKSMSNSAKFSPMMSFSKVSCIVLQRYVVRQYSLLFAKEPLSYVVLQRNAYNVKWHHRAKFCRIQHTLAWAQRWRYVIRQDKLVALLRNNNVSCCLTTLSYNVSTS